MKNRLIALCLAIALVCALLPTTLLTASAETYSGTCGGEGDGSNLIWTLDTETGILNITGTGKMMVWYNSDREVPWYYARSIIKSAIIDSGVTDIGMRAFCECTKLTSVTIPDSVTSIGYRAFRECAELTSVTIPDSVAIISSEAFAHCAGLTSVIIPDSVTDIGFQAFLGCDGLANVTIPASVTHISDNAFYHCPGLRSVTIQNSMTFIGNKAFGYYYNYDAWKTAKIDGFTINGYQNSTAQTYAEENGFSFISLGIPTDPCANGHTWGAWTVGAPATCTTDGEQIRYCTVCNAIDPETLTIPATGHNFVNGVCTRCGANIVTVTPSDINVFCENMYRADRLLCTGTPEAEQLAWLTNVETPCGMMRSVLADTGFADTAAAWKTLTTIWDAVDDPSSLAETLSFSEKDMYSAIILNALSASVEIGYADQCKEITALSKATTSSIADLMYSAYNLDILSKQSFQALPPDRQAKLIEMIPETFEKVKQPDLTSINKVLSNWDMLFKSADCLETLIERICTYYKFCEMSESMKVVLEDLYDTAVKNGAKRELQLAIKDCINIFNVASADMEELLFTEYFVTIGGRFGLSLCFDKLWDCVKAKASVALPHLAVLLAAYKGGKLISNLLFSSDSLVEHYYTMLATLEFESLAKETFNSMKQAYLNDKNEDTAAALLSATDLLYTLFAEDCDKAYAYCDTVDNAVASKIAHIWNKSDYSEVKADIQETKNSSENMHFMFGITWIIYLQEDYPLQYELYKDRLNQTLESMESAKSEYSIHCPVNVSVYDKNGSLVASFDQGRTFADGNLAIMTEGENKLLRFYDSEDYTVACLGYDTGTMDISVTEYANNAAYRNVVFNDLQVDNGCEYVLPPTLSTDESAYVIKNDEIEIEADFDSQSAAEEIAHVKISGGIAFYLGEPITESDLPVWSVIQLEAYPNTGFLFDGWVCEDGSVIPQNPNNELTSATIIHSGEICAEYKPDPQSIRCVIDVGDVSCKSGDTVAVPVTITNNPGFAEFTLVVSPADGLTLTNIEKGKLFNNKAGTFTQDVAHRTVKWASSGNITGDGELLILTFKVDTAAADGKYAISIARKDDEPTNFANAEEQPINVSFTSGEVTVRNASSGDIIIYFTNDVHGAYENYAYAAEIMKDGDFIVDAGDSIQGSVATSLTDGQCMVDVMNAVGYDLAAPGNHEFDFGLDRFLEIANGENTPYISANLWDKVNDKAVLPAYRILEAGGKKIAFIGITTPETLVKSTPTYFQNEAGEWIYDFCNDETGAKLYKVVQAAIDAAKAEGANYVIAIGHLGINKESSPWTSTEVIANVSGLDALIDGHSHSTITEVKKDKDDKDVTVAQTGTKLANVGKMTIAADGTISAELIEVKHGEEAPFDANVAEAVAKIYAEVKEISETVVAKAEVKLTTKDPDTGKRAVRNSETNLGDLCADAYRDFLKTDIAFVNGGGVRADIEIGDVTYGQVIAVHPFGNRACVIKVTGKQIWEALEHGASAYPSESGGFLQVSGLEYTINQAIQTPVIKDEAGMFVGLKEGAPHRVINVRIGGEPLDVNKTYTLGGHNYMLKECGDGYTMFMGCKVLQDEIALDNEVLIRYIRDTLGGVISKNSIYANPRGEGRIRIVNEDHIHSYTTVVITAPTCTEQGYTTHICSTCGDSYVDSYVPALGHALVTDAAVPATCTATGLTAGEHCTRCDYKKAQEVVAALGHKWDDGKVTTAPTATKDGVKTYTCSRCGATKTEVIPATGDKPCDGGKDCPSKNFKDVNKGDWYHEAVDFAVSNGLFNGMSATTFEPNTPMTRAMLVTVLWRYEGSPKEGKNRFTDVKNGQWYTDAVAWAAANGIVGGVGNNKFDPNGNITREQLAAILHRYSDGKGYDVSARGSFAGFPDRNKVSSWATDAYAWAVGEKLITGNDGKLDPQGNATRAQVATILMRFIKGVKPAVQYDPQGHTYEYVRGMYSWEEAQKYAKEKGGYLVRFDSEDEFKYVTKEITKKGYQETGFIIGARRAEGSKDYFFVDGEDKAVGEKLNTASSWTSSYWASGEPTYEWDGVQEWIVTVEYKADEAKWTLNDVPDNATYPADPNRHGFIIEYEKDRQLVVDAYATSVSLIDNSGKEWTFEYSIPEIRIGGSTIESLNKMLYDKLFPQIQERVSATQGGLRYSEISYDWAVRGDVLSVLIYHLDWYDYPEWDVYNISVPQGRILGKTELINAYGMTEESYTEKARQSIASNYLDRYNQYYETNGATADFLEQLNKTVDEKT